MLFWSLLFLLLVLAVSLLDIAFTPAGAKDFAGDLSRHSLGLRSLGAQETGREVALPVFRELMLRVYRDKLVAPVPRFPAQMEQNINDYLAAGPVHTGEFMSALHRETLHRRLRLVRGWQPNRATITVEESAGCPSARRAIILCKIV